MEYAPKKFSGQHAQDIISLVIHENRTVKNNLVRVLDNVKNEEHVTTISGDVPWVDYEEDISEARLDELSEASTLAFSDQTVEPKKLMALDTFKMDDLRNSRFSEDMQKGAANITSNKFEQAVISYLVPRLGKSFEKRFYLGITAANKTAIAASSAPAAQKAWAAAQTPGKVTGIVARMILARIEDADAAVIAVAGAVATTSNIAGIYKSIHAALPSEVAGDSTLFVPEGDFAIILQCNDDQQFRDKFQVSGTKLAEAKVTYLGMQVEFVPIDNVRFAGKAGAQGNFVLATDLLSDAAEFKIDQKNNIGDVKFGKAVAALDATVLCPQQMVLAA
jgi:hypothetical protein